MSHAFGVPPGRSRRQSDAHSVRPSIMFATTMTMTMTTATPVTMATTRRAATMPATCAATRPAARSATFTSAGRRELALARTRATTTAATVVRAAATEVRVFAIDRSRGWVCDATRCATRWIWGFFLVFDAFARSSRTRSRRRRRLDACPWGRWAATRTNPGGMAWTNRRATRAGFVMRRRRR